MTKTLQFTPPTAKTPGFLRRAIRATELSAQLVSGEVTVTLLNELVEFLLDFVVEPSDRDKARTMLLDVSQDQLMELLGTLKGESDAVNPPKPAA